MFVQARIVGEARVFDWSRETTPKHGETLKCIRTWALALNDERYRAAYLKALEPFEEDFRVYTQRWAVPEPPEECRSASAEAGTGEVLKSSGGVSVVSYNSAGVYSLIISGTRLSGNSTSTTTDPSEVEHKYRLQGEYVR